MSTTDVMAGAHAFVFPGQGSQYVGMGADLAGSSEAAGGIFERADKALGFALSRLMFEGPADELDSTINAQPAILAASVAALEHLRERAAAAGVALNPLAVAGHSAGQYAAAIAAGAVDFDEALRLVRERGRIMQERGIDGGMGAVIGLSEEQAEEVVEQAREHGEISVANINAPGQIVLSGVLPADAGDSAEGRTAADNATVRSVFVIGPDKRIKLILVHPLSTGRNFEDILRVIDSMSSPRAPGWHPGELASAQGRDHPAVGLGREGVAPLSGRVARAEPYMRYVPHPH